MDSIDSRENNGKVSGGRTIPAPTLSVQYRQVDPRYNIALMASAGTGKTFNLALRVVITLMQGGRSVHDIFDATGRTVVSEHVSTSRGKILCLTFTRKATAEMMSRVQDFLTQLANGQLAPISIEYQIIAATLNITSPAQMQNMATRARDRVYNDSSLLQIKTIDSFTSLILKLFPFEANVRPDFKVLNETSMELIQRESFIAAFKELSGVKGVSYEELFFRLISWTGEQPYDFTDRLKEQINWVLENAVVLRNEIEGALSVTAEKLSENINLAIENNNKLFLHLSKMLEILRGIDASKYRATLARRFDEFASIAVQPMGVPKVIQGEDKPYAETDAAPSIYSGVAAVRYILENIKPLEPEQVVTKAHLSSVPDVYHDMFAELEDLLREHIKQYTDIDLKLILHIASKVSVAVEEVKGRRGLLSYSDLARIVHTMMGEDDFTLTNDYLYFRLDGRVEHILVDEFQDTSKVQWDMLRPLAEEAMSGVAQRDKVGSFFCVGDSKQTVYRFRGSNPHFFQDIINRYSSVMDREELDTNHRSDKNIITFVNDLFMDANDFLQEQRGQSAEKVPEFEYIRQQAASKEDGYVSVRLALGDKADDRKQHRLEHLKDIIEEVVSYGWSHSDIAILISRKSNGLSVHRYLTNDLDISSTLGYTEYLSTKPAYLIIRALVSYIYTRSKFDLAEFLLISPEVINSEQILSDRVLDRYKALLDGYLNKSKTEALYTRIMNIGKRLSITSRLLEDPDFTLLLNMITHRLPTITNPVDFLDKLSTLASETPSSGERGGDAGISIMTIHGAKGLQFPIVIMFDVNEQFRLHNQLAYFIGDSSEKLFKKLTKAYEPYASQEYIIALETEELMDKYEKINKLYVATTRAKRALFVLIESTNNNNTDKFIATQFPEGLELGVMPTNADSKPTVRRWEKDKFRDLCWSVLEASSSGDSTQEGEEGANKEIKVLPKIVTNDAIQDRMKRYLKIEQQIIKQELAEKELALSDEDKRGAASSIKDEDVKCIDTAPKSKEALVNETEIDETEIDEAEIDEADIDIDGGMQTVPDIIKAEVSRAGHEDGRTISNASSTKASLSYEPFASRQFGILFHEVVYQLSKLKMDETREIEFVDNAVNKAWYRYGGYLDTSAHATVKDRILQLIELPQWVDWVSAGDIYREKSIFHAGRLLIVDMYIVKENRIVVLDFKTGSASGGRREEYVDQVSSYMKGIASQYENYAIEGYLLFVSEERLDVVNVGAAEN